MMFRLSEEYLNFRDGIRDFVDKHVRPKSMKLDETAEFPMDTYRMMGERGLFGLTVPKEYDGSGRDSLYLPIAVEEVAKGCASTGSILAAAELSIIPLLKFGTEKQKQKYVKPLVSGKKIGAFALTEPDAGSDAGNQSTTATLSGDEYVISGTKRYIFNGSKANTIVLFATVDKSKGPKGICAFIVESNYPGFRVSKIENKMGIRAADTAELTLENLRVPVENLLGKEGEGFKIALSTLDYGRIGIASQALGIAQAALDESIKHAKTRVQFGKPIGEFQAIQWMLAEVATDIDAARLLVYRAAIMMDTGERFSKEASMAKLFASQTATKATDYAVQIHGGSGYMKDCVIERLYRDTRITEIYEGTSEVQKMVIAGNLLR